VFYNEMSLYEEGKLAETLAELRAQDLIYESEGATWLRATALGLDRDRVLIKGSGEPTYLLPDVAYHREKFRRGFELVIDVQGADHYGQFPFVRRAAALGSSAATRSASSSSCTRWCRSPWAASRCASRSAPAPS
jgi:arginyl-tRNA synthetase